MENLTSEHREKLELETDYDSELKSEDFNLDQIVESAVNWASNPISLNVEPINLTLTSIKPSPSLELKALPTHLKYVYLGTQETFPVIIASNLTGEKEENLKQFLGDIRKPLVEL